MIALLIVSSLADIGIDKKDPLRYPGKGVLFEGRRKMQGAKVLACSIDDDEVKEDAAYCDSERLMQS
jgi:hypothetical protein